MKNDMSKWEVVDTDKINDGMINRVRDGSGDHSVNKTNGESNHMLIGGSVKDPIAK